MRGSSTASTSPIPLTTDSPLSGRGAMTGSASASGAPPPAATVAGPRRQRSSPGGPAVDDVAMIYLVDAVRAFADRIVIHGRFASTPPIDCQQVEVRTSWDSQTELANRAYFAERLHYELAWPARTESHLAVMFTGVHGLAAVNATWGYETGIRVFSLVTGRLVASLRSPDTLTRVGASQFAVICPDLIDVEQAMIVADRMRAATGAGILIAGRHVTLSLSVSVAFARHRSIQMADKSAVEQ